MVISCFHYAIIIWNPHAVKYFESIEGGRQRATKVVPEIKIYHLLKDFFFNVHIFNRTHSKYIQA